MNAEARLRELKLELPPAPKPVAVYKPLVVVGNLAYVSGHGPVKPDKCLITGRVGQDLDLTAGKTAARQVGLAILATPTLFLNGVRYEGEPDAEPVLAALGRASNLTR
jgi:hypothetical protein